MLLQYDRTLFLAPLMSRAGAGAGVEVKKIDLGKVSRIFFLLGIKLV